MEYMKYKGFAINPYDPCVANKIIGGKKMTVFWYVDNLKVSNVVPKVVTNFMEFLEGIYWGMSTTRFKVNKYLGMALDLQTPGEILVTMVYYLKEVLENFPEVITGRITILVYNNLFQVRPEDGRTLLD